jgi:ADP-heptose:LPS heptosyltransferase
MHTYVINQVATQTAHKTRLSIITPRNAQMLRELAAAYTTYCVAEAGRHSVEGGIGLRKLLPLMFKTNCVVIAQTPQTLPLYTYVLARALTLRTDSILVMFDDKVTEVAEKNKAVHVPRSPHDSFYASLARAFSIVGFDISENPTISYIPQEEIFTHKELKKESYIVLHPFAASAVRNISEDDLVWLLQQLRSAFPGTFVVITGSAADKKKAERICAALEDEKVRNFCGELSMQELATVIDNATLFVGVDTGITHIAAMLRVDSVVVAHNSYSTGWLPYYNENATIVYKLKGESDVDKDDERLRTACPKGSGCFDRVPIEPVYERIVEKLSRP